LYVHSLHAQEKLDTGAIKRQLAEIAESDQLPRRMGDPNQMRINDSMNLIQVKAIVDKYGWLGKSVIGPSGNFTLWLVIQHADRELETQKRYLALLEQSVADSESRPVDLAYLRDRVLKNEGKKQVYGTQAWVNPKTQLQEIWPIYDAANVNTRRAQVGLGTVEDYAKMLDAVYPPIDN